MKKNLAVYTAFALLAIFGVMGWARAEMVSGSANGSASASVDGDTIDRLYDVVFHRAADAEGKAAHLGKNLRTVLDDFRRAPEQRYYGALFKAVKSYEEAQRAPGTLSDDEKQSHLDLIDSALASLVAWVGTLPDKDPCRAVITEIQAKAAVQEAHDGLTVSAQASAETDVFGLHRNLGNPRNLMIFNRCTHPTNSPEATVMQ